MRESVLLDRVELRRMSELLCTAQTSKQTHLDPLQAPLVLRGPRGRGAARGFLRCTPRNAARRHTATSSANTSCAIRRHPQLILCRRNQDPIHAIHPTTLLRKAHARIHVKSAPRNHFLESKPQSLSERKPHSIRSGNLPPAQRRRRDVRPTSEPTPPRSA